jgi:large subunit ribosomal protein L15
VKYDPDRFGKKGFKPVVEGTVTTINVGELDEQIDGFLEKKQAEQTKQGIEVSLDRLGYNKLLGRGKVTHPLIIQVDAYSESAAKKIKEAGGKILKNE